MATITKRLSLSKWSRSTASQKEYAVSSFLQRVQDPTLQQLKEQHQSVCNEIKDILDSSSNQSGYSSFSDKNTHANMILEELTEIRNCIHGKIQARSESLTPLY